MKKLRYFSTFTGIGGLDWGLEKLGAACVGFSEIKESSIEIYKRHYNKHHNFGDITKIGVEKLPDFDVLTGGFPCQSFSIAGVRKGFGDRRGTMIFYLYDILMTKKPKYAVLENVKGIATHDGGKTIKNVFKLLASAGYFVRVLMLNSAHYGSAQARERVVFVCRLREDFQEVAPIKMDDTKRFRDVRDEDTVGEELSGASVARLERARKGFEIIGGYDRVNTLTTGVSSSGRRMLVTESRGGSWRRITPLEAERLQGFPDGWTEGSTRAERWFALGNAVNCKMSEYLFTDYLPKVWPEMVK